MLNSIMITKECSKCHVVKDIDEFAINKRVKSGHQTWCRVCDNTYKREWRTLHPGKNKEWKQKNPKKVMYQAAKQRAKLFNVPFTITLEDINVPAHCPILGFPLVSHLGEGKHFYDSPSLDRIQPELGYIPGNVWVISSRANLMKNDASHEELLRFAHWIFKRNEDNSGIPSPLWNYNGGI